MLRYNNFSIKLIFQLKLQPNTCLRSSSSMQKQNISCIVVILRISEVLMQISNLRLRRFQVYSSMFLCRTAPKYPTSDSFFQNIILKTDDLRLLYNNSSIESCISGHNYQILFKNLERTVLQQGKLSFIPYPKKEKYFQGAFPFKKLNYFLEYYSNYCTNALAKKF